MKPILGIDFGTSTARAAVAVGGDVKMVAQAGGAWTIPAIVAFPPAATGGGPPLVGGAADTVSARHPERTIVAVKRLLGRRLEAPEVRHHRQTVPYDLVGTRNGDARVRVGRRHHAPQDIAAYVIETLRGAAERQVSGPVTDVVLAVPAMFNDLQRQALCDSARIAGLRVIGVLTSTAAAVLGSGVYPAPKGEERKTLVYDLGGGSFEVSAVMVGDRTAEVLANGGDSFLGGEDFDERIVAYVCEEVLKAGGGDLRRDRTLLARLKQVAERVKVELSVAEGVDIHLPESSTRVPLAVRLDRARMETLTQDLVDRTIWACESVLREAQWSANDVDLVMMIGGQTGMPRIRAQLAEVCGKPPIEIPQSDCVVAVGAAQHAAILAGTARGRGKSRAPIAVTELTSLSLGLEAAGGVFTRLVPRGTALPGTHAQLVSTSADGQTQIILHLLQGEREMASDNESVARILIGPLPARPRGEIQLEVDISTNGGGLPTAVARVVESGEVKQARVRPSAGLVESEIVALAAAHAAGSNGAGILSSDNALVEIAAGDVDHDSGGSETGDPLLQGG
ncbi:MAG: Hsp70 family protein [Deltaproteobacteria bacterium]|nr:Hsp70 family protein [Deltaproteobacteria bacterium]